MVININKFDNQIELIKNDIKNYEINIYETISIIKNMSFYWNDSYTKSFFRKANQILQNTNDFIDYMYRFVKYLKIISTNYHSINNKKRNLLGYTSSIINSNSFVIYATDEEELANKKRIISNAIIDTESQIGAMIFKLGIPYVEKMSFDSLDEDRIDDINEFVGMLDNMPTEIKKLEQKKRDALTTSDRLKESLSAIINLYNSKNNKRLIQIINEIDDTLTLINNNINRAYEYINRRKEKYKDMFSEIADDASKI